VLPLVAVTSVGPLPPPRRLNPKKTLSVPLPPSALRIINFPSSRPFQATPGVSRWNTFPVSPFLTSFPPPIGGWLSAQRIFFVCFNSARGGPGARPFSFFHSPFSVPSTKGTPYWDTFFYFPPCRRSLLFFHRPFLRRSQTISF